MFLVQFTTSASRCSRLTEWEVLEVCSAQLCSLGWHRSHAVMPVAELSGYLTHVSSRRFSHRHCVSVTCAVHAAVCVLQTRHKPAADDTSSEVLCLVLKAFQLKLFLDL